MLEESRISGEWPFLYVYRKILCGVCAWDIDFCLLSWSCILAVCIWSVALLLPSVKLPCVLCRWIVCWCWVTNMHSSRGWGTNCQESSSWHTRKTGCCEIRGGTVHCCFLVFCYAFAVVDFVLWCCWLGGWKEGHPACKNWVVGCWHGYLSGVRCRLAYGPADATATHYLLLQ